MLSLELCKALKDAGFPQEESLLVLCMAYRREIICTRNDCPSYTNWIALPTLSELIEACGDIILYKLPKNNTWDSEFNGMWIAAKSSTFEDQEYLCASDGFIDTSFNGEAGKSPEEAVANLYLALNKK